MKKIWILIAKIGGWKFILPEKGSRPELSRCVFATAPHTSIADYLVGTAYLWQLGVNGHIFIKKEFFWGPLGPLLRHLGAISIARVLGVSVPDLFAHATTTITCPHCGKQIIIKTEIQ